MLQARTRWFVSVAVGSILGCSGDAAQHPQDDFGSVGGTAAAGGGSVALAAGSGGSVVVAAGSGGSVVGSGRSAVGAAGTSGAPNGIAGASGVSSGAAGASVGAGGMKAESRPMGELDVGPPPPFEGEGEPWLEVAPRATCASGDQKETGDQGLSGNVRCNLSVLGKVAAPHFLSMAWMNDCAYVNGQSGTTVIDVANPASPTVVKTLTTQGMTANWESMKASEKSGLLVGYQSSGDAILDVYDVAKDCKNPTLQKSFDIGMGDTGHAGSFSPDGTIYYASSLYTATVYAIDLTAPSTPKILTTMYGGAAAHDLFIGKDGTRGYFAFPGSALGTGSLAIIDLTDVQARKPSAVGKVIKDFMWEDGNVTQYPIPITYRGKDYLMVTDELGSGSCDDPMKPPYGYARIFDISDEMNPTLVSKIKTTAQSPCKGQPPSDGFFGVGTHYCNVDRLNNPRLLACGNWEAGLRVYDIRNPWRPKELAYFDTASEGVPGLARILVDKGMLWVTTTPGTFYVLKFADGVLEPIIGSDP
jgi:hypothetical protein